MPTNVNLANVSNTIANIPRQMLTTKLSTMYFAIVRLDNRKLWVVWRSISLTIR